MASTRDRILQVTEELLRWKGSTHMITKEIARAVGLSESALYRHFDHKEEIFFALMAEHLPAFHEAFQTHQPDTATARKNLVALAVAAVRYYEHLIPMGAPFWPTRTCSRSFERPPDHGVWGRRTSLSGWQSTNFPVGLYCFRETAVKR